MRLSDTDAIHARAVARMSEYDELAPDVRRLLQEIGELPPVWLSTIKHAHQINNTVTLHVDGKIYVLRPGPRP